MKPPLLMKNEHTFESFLGKCRTISSSLVTATAYLSVAFQALWYMLIPHQLKLSIPLRKRGSLSYNILSLLHAFSKHVLLLLLPKISLLYIFEVKYFFRQLEAYEIKLTRTFLARKFRARK